MTPDEERGWAARFMIAEDARWAADFARSAGKHPEISPYFGLLISHHFVRIAYEGTVALKSSNPNVGIPVLVDLLDEKFAAITSRIRHLTKLLDDNKKSYEEVLSNLSDVITEHHEAFTGNALRFARFLETDLGLYLIDGQLLGTSWTSAYRLNITLDINGNANETELRSMSEEWGGVIAVLCSATFDLTDPEANLDLSPLSTIVGRDKQSRRYLKHRFEPEFTNSLKMLLLLIEGEMNTLLSVMAPSASRHPFPVFRARTIALHHSLTALTQVVTRYGHIDSPGMRQLQALLEDPATQSLLSKEGKMVRNRCMHYEIWDSSVNIDPSLPMLGIIESVFPGHTWSSYNEIVVQTIERVAEFLRGWKPAR